MPEENLKNPDLLIFTFCENIIEDVSRKFSIINLFDTIHINDLPGVFACKLFISMQLLAGQYSIRLKSISPSGEVFDGLINNDMSQGNIGIHNIVVNLAVDVKELGNYVFQLFVNDNLIGERVINVLIDTPSTSTREK